MKSTEARFSIAAGFFALMAAVSGAAAPAIAQPAPPTVVVDAINLGDYLTISAALSSSANWCGTPGPGSPCVIKVNAGIFDQGGTTLALKPYIEIEGSGVGATVIRGSNATTNGVVKVANGSVLRNLSVENTGGGANSVAISGNTVTVDLDQVDAIARNGSSATYGISSNRWGGSFYNVRAEAVGPAIAQGIRLLNTPWGDFWGGRATASAGTGGTGIFIQNSTGTVSLFSVEASGEGTTTNNSYGIRTSSATVYMDDVRAAARGGGSLYGVFIGGGTAVGSGLGADATGTGAVYGFSASNFATVTLDSSRVEVATTPGNPNYFALNNTSDSDLNVSKSWMKGGRSASSTRTCADTTIADSWLSTGTAGPYMLITGGTCSTPPATLAIAASFTDVPGVCTALSVP